MRILMVNWAPLRTGASLGGGANGYLHDLALTLAQRGHHVGSLSGGLIHVPTNQGKQGPCRVRRVEDYQGVQAFEVINSPVLAWSLHQFRHPKVEISSPVLDAEFARFVRLWKPDIVHFHNIEGFTAMCPEIARTPSRDWPGAKVVYSLHNYHSICPQVFLMHAGTTPCTHFDNGQRCTNCFDAPHTHIVLEDRLRDAAREAKREDVFAPGRPDGLLERLAWKPPPEIPLPAHPAETPEDLARPINASPASFRADEPSVKSSGAEPRSIRLPVVGGPLTNAIAPEPHSSQPDNDYALRRRAMIHMLSTCDRVIAVSDFVARKFESMGVKTSKVTTLTIGTRMSQIAQRAGLTAPPPPISKVPGDSGERLSRPLRLAFLGYHNFYKGLHVVCAALELLPEPIRRQIDLAVHAKDVAPIRPWLRQLSFTMARVVIENGYTPDEVPILLRGVDLGLVPSVWWDNGPQTVFEFLACNVPVLASAVGGIPDVLTHGSNGLLVPGNDPASLARELVSIIESPDRLATLRAGITPPKDMPTHAAEIEREYQNCLL